MKFHPAWCLVTESSVYTTRLLLLLLLLFLLLLLVLLFTGSLLFVSAWPVGCFQQCISKSSDSDEHVSCRYRNLFRYLLHFLIRSILEEQTSLTHQRPQPIPPLSVSFADSWSGSHWLHWNIPWPDPLSGWSVSGNESRPMYFSTAHWLR